MEPADRVVVLYSLHSMPTFTSVTLDRFLEPGEAKSSPKRTMPTIENNNQFADSSSFSFPPSPQIINQKRNFSQGEGRVENARNVNGKDVFVGGAVTSPNADVVKTYDKFNGYSNGKLLNVSVYNGNGDLVPAGSDADITSDDFFDPRDTLSVVSSADTEDCTGSFCNFKMSTPMAEFYDAPDGMFCLFIPFVLIFLYISLSIDFFSWNMIYCFMIISILLKGVLNSR